jgi:hypothetical protein
MAVVGREVGVSGCTIIRDFKVLEGTIGSI